jgi:hypothetical protein
MKVFDFWREPIITPGFLKYEQAEFVKRVTAERPPPTVVRIVASPSIDRAIRESTFPSAIASKRLFGTEIMLLSGIIVEVSGFLADGSFALEYSDGTMEFHGPEDITIASKQPDAKA